MAEIKTGRWTAAIEGDFVVFLIGARIDKRHPLRSRNMAPFGLGKASTLVTVAEGRGARERLRNAAGGEAVG